MNLNGSQHDLERRADVTRERLLGTIDALDRRRHELFDLKVQLRRHARDIRVGSLGLLGGAAVAGGVALYLNHRERHLQAEWWRAFGRLLRHPERIARPRHDFVGTIALSVLVAATSMVTTAGAQRQLDQHRRRPRLPAPPIEPLGV